MGVFCCPATSRSLGIFDGKNGGMSRAVLSRDVCTCIVRMIRLCCLFILMIYVVFHDIKIEVGVSYFCVRIMITFSACVFFVCIWKM